MTQSSLFFPCMATKINVYTKISAIQHFGMIYYLFSEIFLIFEILKENMKIDKLNFIYLPKYPSPEIRHAQAMWVARVVLN